MSETKRYILKNYEIFWDNGKWVAVRTGPDGVRRNIAPYNCRSKKEAVGAAREDRDWLNKNQN
ncbi:MAG: hypothetical protein KKD44_27430 [Proteobacteria bacterium]|nr:hypothetical protein [Pseudomonadota bacterium]